MFFYRKNIISIIALVKMNIFSLALVSMGFLNPISETITF